MGSNLSVTNLNVMFTWHIDLRYVIKLSQTKSYIDIMIFDADKDGEGVC